MGIGDYEPEPVALPEPRHFLSRVFSQMRAAHAAKASLSLILASHVARAQSATPAPRPAPTAETTAKPAPTPTPTGSATAPATSGVAEGYPSAPTPGPASAQPSPPVVPQAGTAWDYPQPPPSPYYLGYPPVPPAGTDSGKLPVKEREPLVSRAEVGGTLSEGLDATNAGTRAGGFYGSGSYRFAKDFLVTGRYAFSAGHVTERLPGNKGGQFGVPDDVDVLETRHAFDLQVGYLLRVAEGPIQIWATPLIGPRLSFFVNDVATRTAFEAEFGGRAGVWSGEKLELSVLLAYAPAIAKTHDLADVQGPILSELRFGAGANVRLDGPLGMSLAYEGDVVTLDHQTLTSHGLFLGFSYALE